MKTNPQLLTELLSNKMIWTDTTQSKKKESGTIAENNSNGKKSILFAFNPSRIYHPPPPPPLGHVDCIRTLSSIPYLIQRNVGGIMAGAETGHLYTYRKPLFLILPNNVFIS